MTRNVSVFQRVQTDAGAHTISYSYYIGYRGTSSRKWLEHKADPTSPFTVKLKNLWSCNFASSYPFMAWVWI